MPNTLRDRVAREPRPHHDGGGCWFCRLPEDVRAQVDEAKRNRTATAQQTLTWLVEDLGYEDATFGKLHYHFQSRHHLDGAQ